MQDTFTVALITDYGWTETCHPLAIGVDKATAKSIRRHYSKTCNYDDYNGTGTYVMMVSREFCHNHEDFEKDTTLSDEEPDWDYEDDYDIFEPSAEDLVEWQMASCGLV